MIALSNSSHKNEHGDETAHILASGTEMMQAVTLQLPLPTGSICCSIVPLNCQCFVTTEDTCKQKELFS
jgi:hypothetical protein